MTDYDTYTLSGASPTDICWDMGSAKYWVADGNGAVWSLNDDGSDITSYELGGASPTAICSGLGYIWLADSNGSLRKVDPSNGSSQSFGTQQSAIDVCIGPDGNVWMVYNDLAQFASFDPTTGQQTTYGLSSTEGVNLVSICSGPDGRVWAGDANESFTGIEPAIWAVTPGSTSSSQAYYLGWTQGGMPTGIAADAAYIWFFDSNYGCIFSMSTSGNLVSCALIGDSTNDYPYGGSPGPQRLRPANATTILGVAWDANSWTIGRDSSFMQYVTGTALTGIAQGSVNIAVSDITAGAVHTYVPGASNGTSGPIEMYYGPQSAQEDYSSYPVPYNQPSLAQSTSATGLESFTVTLNDVTAGNTLILCVGASGYVDSGNNPVTTPCTITDSNTGDSSWVDLLTDSEVTVSSNGVAIQMFMLTDALAGAHAVLVTIPGTAAPQITQATASLQEWYWLPNALQVQVFNYPDTVTWSDWTLLGGQSAANESEPTLVSVNQYSQWAPGTTFAIGTTFIVTPQAVQLPTGQDAGYGSPWLDFVCANIPVTNDTEIAEYSGLQCAYISTPIGVPMEYSGADQYGYYVTFTWSVAAVPISSDIIISYASMSIAWSWIPLVRPPGNVIAWNVGSIQLPPPPTPIPYVVQVAMSTNFGAGGGASNPSFSNPPTEGDIIVAIGVDASYLADGFISVNDSTVAYAVVETTGQYQTTDWNQNNGGFFALYEVSGLSSLGDATSIGTGDGGESSTTVDANATQSVTYGLALAFLDINQYATETWNEAAVEGSGSIVSAGTNWNILGTNNVYDEDTLQGWSIWALSGPTSANTGTRVLDITTNFETITGMSLIVVCCTSNS